MPTLSVPSDPDDRARFPLSWELYLSLLEARGERSRPRYVLVDGTLTVVSPGTSRERSRARLGGLIEDVLVGLRIKFCPTGGATLLHTLQPRTGAEADGSYYLTNVELARGKKDLLMGVDPAPDLVIEVAVSHLEHDAVEAYRRFGVREVWVYRVDELMFLVLGADGRYTASTTSAVLPFLKADEMADWVCREDVVDESELRHEFRAWVTETLAPRHRPAADA
jgi:Uma2 family endonuclease